MDINKTLNDILIDACLAGNLEMVKTLIEEKGADINYLSDKFDTPLIAASKNNHLNIVEYLVDKGADINKTDDNHGPSALMIASGNKNSLEIVKYLVRKGAEVNYYDNKDNTAVLFACKSGSFNIFKYLVDNGANLGDTNFQDKTCLILATEALNSKIVEYLLESGADIDKKDIEGKTALSRALENNDPRIIELLFINGAEYTDEQMNSIRWMFWFNRNKVIDMIALRERNLNENITGKEFIKRAKDFGYKKNKSKRKSKRKSRKNKRRSKSKKIKSKRKSRKSKIKKSLRTLKSDNSNIIIFQKSKNADKKFAVTIGNKTINFGAKGYSDFTIHKDYDRMRRYENRHKSREDWTKSGIKTAGFWSKWILWNKPSLSASINDTEKRFGIKIKYKRS